MPAISNAIWLSSSRVLADVLSFLLFVAVARAFGPAGTGQYSYSFAIGSLVALAATSGFEEFGIREYARSAVEARARIWSDIISTLGAQLGLALVGLGIFLAFNDGRSAPASVILELTVFQLASALARAMFVPAMASQAMMAPALLELGGRVLAIVLALGALLLPHPPPLAVSLLPFPVASIVLLVLAYRNSVNHGALWRVNLRWSVLRATWRRTAHFAGSETLNQFYARTDLLMIAYFLGEERVGLYATDIKFVEVGIVPLTLLGMALYPVFTTLAAGPAGTFAAAARDFCRIQLALSGWLAVGMSLLIPLLIVPLFGARFEPATALLPWFALLAIVKGAEVALYRLLYSVQRQSVYFRSLALGVTVMATLNVLLIPRIGIIGAVQAAVFSICCVVLVCVAGLARQVPLRVFVGLALRSAVALAFTWGLVVVARAAGAMPWLVVTLGCCLFPCVAALAGLVPNPSRSTLFDRKHQPLAAG
jgi:O-antigen/teichoic acid export membrane protein